MPYRAPADAEDMMRVCPQCSGTGRVWSEAQQTDVMCPICGGEGRISQRRYLAWERSHRPAP